MTEKIHLKERSYLQEGESIKALTLPGFYSGQHYGLQLGLSCTKLKHPSRQIRYVLSIYLSINKCNAHSLEAGLSAPHDLLRHSSAANVIAGRVRFAVVNGNGYLNNAELE
jgi:hypothetical protein